MLTRLQLVFVIYELVPRAGERIVALCKRRIFIIVHANTRGRVAGHLDGQTADDLRVEIQKQGSLPEAAEQNSFSFAVKQGKRVLRHARRRHPARKYGRILQIGIFLKNIHKNTLLSYNHRY